jgi:Uma2 family endonuclease
MCEVGIIGPDERLELIEGELVVVSPPSPEHAWTIDEFTRELSLLYGRAFTVRVQSSAGGLEHSLPEPDLAVRPTSGPWTAEDRHPRLDEEILVIEISVTSQRADRRKVALYARGGAPVYWLVDVDSRTVTVHRGPRPDGTWQHIAILGEDGELEPPALDARLPVAAFLPPLKPDRPTPS